MTASLSQNQLESIVIQAFTEEVNALKPGNVSRYAAGHNMSVEDFLKSAEQVTPILCDPSLSVGERILSSVQATFSGVGCNTNLGMVLLFAPVLKVVQEMKIFNINTLQKNIKKLIKNINVDESRLIFKAISLANPGGLGQSEQYDVHLAPDCTVWQAMELASNRDSIAKQYVNGLHEVFHSGLVKINSYNQRWKSVEWATVACYLDLLSDLIDSHVARKQGLPVAEQTRAKAKSVARKLENYDNPVEATDLLLEFDRELKQSNINPGTTADLTAASLLIFGLYKFRDCR